MSKANRQTQSKDPYPADTAVNRSRNSQDALDSALA